MLQPSQPRCHTTTDPLHLPIRKLAHCCQKLSMKSNCKGFEMRFCWYLYIWGTCESSYNFSSFSFFCLFLYDKINDFIWYLNPFLSSHFLQHCSWLHCMAEMHSDGLAYSGLPLCFMMRVIFQLCFLVGGLRVKQSLSQQKTLLLLIIFLILRKIL